MPLPLHVVHVPVSPLVIAKAQLNVGDKTGVEQVTAVLAAAVVPVDFVLPVELLGVIPPKAENVLQE